jgi:nucleotide-binding universal stress UspA family protein
MFRTVLLTVDINEESSWRKALPAAVFQLRGGGGALHALTVLPDFGEGIVGSYFPAGFAERSQTAAASALEDLCSHSIPREIALVCAVRRGSIYREIMRYADEIECDLIVMASHRPELSDYLLGPNAARVVRHAKQSVLVVRD